MEKMKVDSSTIDEKQNEPNITSAIRNEQKRELPFFFWGLRLLSFVMLILSLIIMLYLLMNIITNPTNKRYIEKDPIKKVMCNTIKNGGELSSIKHIYNTRNIEDVTIDLFWGKRNYYADDYPLTGILNDLLVDYLQQEAKDKDSVYYVALCHIIEENEKQNPFDNLEKNQKYSFENIQVKLDSTYTKISSDVTKIADELYNKNQLVNQYLNKSDVSFYISIAALIITILLSCYQIYQNYSTSKREFRLEP